MSISEIFEGLTTLGLFVSVVLVFKNYLLNAVQTASIMLLAAQGKLASAEVVRAQATRIVKDEWDNNGGMDYWDEIKHDSPVVPHVRALIEQVLG